ncbi:hypothetical protein [Terrabacter sp. NPDC000476]|uniref:hypothetical protein n=1 Tax=Terrabacter sp. NPDC000476 TaxID=3154258 RepID=UPI00331A0CE6
MDARVEPGWYYAGEGLLRFRDEHGWTSDVLLAEDIRGLEWPPPPPERPAGTVAGTAADDEPATGAVPRSGVEASPAEGGRGIRRRLRRQAAGRHSGSHRASA